MITMGLTAKSSRSNFMYYKAPTEEEVKELSRRQGTELQDEMANNIFKARQLQKQIDDINRKLADKKTLNWEDRQQIKDLLKKQQDLQRSVEELKNKNQEKAKTDQQFKEFNPELLEKQILLEKLFNELMTEEMKEMMKQMEQMLDQADKEKITEMMDKMKLSNEDIEKELDRSLDLFKQLEFDKKLSDAIDKLDTLNKTQEQLRKEMEESKTITDEQKEDQKQINKDFENLRKELDELKEMNKNLESPANMPDTKPREEKISNSLNKSSQSMQQGKKKDAAGSQKESEEEMEKLKDEMENFQQESEEEQQAEDIATLRKILDNLVRISFRQENLMKQFSMVSRQDPRFPALIEQQKQISQDLKVVEDSLFALSKRQLQLESFINREINEINFNSDKALKALIDMNTVGMVASTTLDESQRRQQNVMTSVNTLSLMLSESLKSMQQQSNSKKSGKNCKNPKQGNGGKPSAGNMKKLQEQLNKQMQQMKEQMGKGGKSPKGQPSMSEQLARMAAQQEAIRKMMQEYREQLMKDGIGDKGNMSKMMQDMEKTETDLVNKIITQETLNRQQEILTRLLESEKAEKERELDKKESLPNQKCCILVTQKSFWSIRD